LRLKLYTGLCEEPHYTVCTRTVTAWRYREQLANAADQACRFCECPFPCLDLRTQNPSRFTRSQIAVSSPWCGTPHGCPQRHLRRSYRKVIEDPNARPSAGAVEKVRYVAVRIIVMGVVEQIGDQERVSESHALANRKTLAHAEVRYGQWISVQAVHGTVSVAAHSYLSSIETKRIASRAPRNHEGTKLGIHV